MFLGLLGAHRFYVGKPLTAVLQTLTLGGLGIWLLVDFVLLIGGVFRNSEGELLVEWI